MKTVWDILLHISTNLGWFKFTRLVFGIKKSKDFHINQKVMGYGKRF